MLTCLNALLEMAATLICVNHLFCKKYYFRIHDAVFLLSEVIIIEIANYLGLSKGAALFGYIGIYIYELTKFKCSVRKANVNMILFIIFGVFVQIICSIPVFILSDWVLVDILVIVVNFFMIIVFLIFSKKGYFFKLSEGIMGYDRLTNAATLICFAGAAYLLVVYKMEEFLRITDYIIFGVWTGLIGILIMSWQREKFDKIAKEKELELRNTYDTVYEQLLQTIQKKQHDFHNHITAIFSHHMLAKDYDTLVSMQKKYCGELLRDNRYARLLSSRSPMIIAFLYSKFIEAEEKGCHIDYNIKVDKMKCRIPQYRIVEILGVLLDNAVEAVMQYVSKNIYVEISETYEKIHIVIKNDSRVFSRDELIAFVQPGYSTKNKGRGIGLPKVVEILKEYDCEFMIYCEKENVSKIVVGFEVEKEQ